MAIPSAEDAERQFLMKNFCVVPISLMTEILRADMDLNNTEQPFNFNTAGHMRGFEWRPLDEAQCILIKDYKKHKCRVEKHPSNKV